jgi:hypothetical protein
MEHFGERHEESSNAGGYLVFSSYTLRATIRENKTARVHGNNRHSSCNSRFVLCVQVELRKRNLACEMMS